MIPAHVLQYPHVVEVVRDPSQPYTFCHVIIKWSDGEKALPIRFRPVQDAQELFKCELLAFALVQRSFYPPSA